MFFSFVGGCSFCPGVALDYFPRQWPEELYMMHDDYLFVLQFHARSFGASWCIEMALLFF
jgi:hypothetical protein